MNYMEITRHLQVEAKDFFDAIAESAAYDMTQSTGNHVTAAQIQPGYSYKKALKNKLGQKADVEITINRFLSPQQYEVSFRSTQGNNIVSYDIDSQPDGSIVVCYKENFEGINKTKSLNYKLVSWIYTRGAKKRILQTLAAIEQYIKNSKRSDSLQI